jgi:hypothetical protein
MHVGGEIWLLHIYSFHSKIPLVQIQTSESQIGGFSISNAIEFNDSYLFLCYNQLSSSTISEVIVRDGATYLLGQIETKMVCRSGVLMGYVSLDI